VKARVFIDEDQYDNFQTFLDNYGTWDNETFYNMKRNMMMVRNLLISSFSPEDHMSFMFQLTPKCEDFLLNCFVGGKKFNCLDKKLFRVQNTMYGPCCTFDK